MQGVVSVNYYNKSYNNDNLDLVSKSINVIFRSRLAGVKPKEISSKLNFSSFLDHYQSYGVAQQLYNKMVRLL